MTMGCGVLQVILCSVFIKTYINHIKIILYDNTTPNTMFYRSLHHPPNPPKRNMTPILQKTMSFSGTHYTPPPPPKLPFVIFGVLFFYLVTRRM